MNIVLVFLGGGIGSVLRYGIALGMGSFNPTFPYATLLANVLSCILLGSVATLFLNETISTNARLFFITGICGGFSTFSTFTNETFLLFQQENIALAFLNILLNLALCFLGLYLGIKLIN
ncbi:MAG: hypothetical protein RLZZ292_529 [Bacteroidota bacterium]|jgi:CrcB protein